MAPDEPNHGRERGGSLLPLDPTVDFRIGQRQQFLECRDAGTVETPELGIGKPPKHEIHFLRAAMMRTIKRAFYPGLDRCHGEICADGCGCPN